MKEGLFISHFSSLSEGEIFQFIQRHRLYSDDLIDAEYSFTKSDKWKEKVKDQVSRSLHLASVFTGLVFKLKEAHIDAIPLKGPVLAYSLYGDVGKRYYGDLDLLVDRDNVGGVKEVLGQLGFEQFHPSTDLTSSQWDYYFRWKKDIGLISRDQRVAVELHTGIYYHELLDRKGEKLLFQDLVELDFAGIKIRCMNRESTFLYLTYHGGQHQYFRLFWLRDVAEALKRWELDHQKILKYARTLGIERMLCLGLELSKEIFPGEIPEEYVELLKENSRAVKRLKRLCMLRILGPEKPTFIGKFQHHYFLFLLKPGLKYKWNVLISIFHRWYIRKFLGGH